MVTNLFINIAVNPGGNCFQNTCRKRESRCNGKNSVFSLEIVVLCAGVLVKKVFYGLEAVHTCFSDCLLFHL